MIFGRKRDDVPPTSQPQAPDPAADARAQREADVLRATAREMPDIDPADAECW